VIRALQLWLAPLVGAALTLWAATLALAAEAYAPLPRMLALRTRPVDSGLPSVPRRLHLIRLALLLMGGAMAAAAVAWWTRPAAEGIPRFLLAVLLVWLVGDLLPRVLAAIAPDLVTAVQPVATLSLRVFDPLLRFVAWADRRMRRIPSGAASSRSAGANQAMFRGVFALRDMTVAEVMTPRIDIVAVDLGASREEVIDALRRSGHSRLMVYEGHPDAVVGVIYAKDLLPRGGTEDANWESLIRPAAFVPEAKSLAAQLRDFQRGPSHMAVVVDEFGGTAGLVTLEDVLEQIVGEIHDEYDVEEAAPILEQVPGRWVVQGGVPLAELEAHLAHRFEREDVDTVGGLILAVLGHVPRVAETVELGPYRLTVDQVIRRRVGRVVVEAVAPVSAEEEDRVP
jgi:CBS domain containing-hemolysin-like protein